MLIGPNGDAKQSAYNAASSETKTATLTGTSSGATQPTASATVTLSDAALQLANQAIQIDQVTEMPSTMSVPTHPKKTGKKPASQLAMLDVDAMRTIWDKLRAQSLETREPGLQEKKLRDEQQENNIISL